MSRKNNYIDFYIIAIILMFGQSAFSQFGIQNFGGVRPIGMGDAFTAVANDENALYYNPAALACLKKLHISVLFNANMWGDQKSYKVYEFLASKHSEFHNELDGTLQNNDIFYKDLERHYNFLSQVRFNTKLFEIVKSNFGFSLIAQQYMEHKIYDVKNKTLLSFNNNTSTSAIVGYGKTLSYFKDKFWHYGISIRYTVSQSFPTPKLITTGSEFWDYFEKPNVKKIHKQTKMDQYLGVDLGLLYEIRNWGVQSGFVIRDFMFLSEQISQKRSYYWGAAFIPTEFLELNTIKSLIISVDYDNFTGEERTIKDKFQIGGEIGIPILSLRAGVAFGYLMYGARLNLGFIRLDAACAPNYYSPYTKLRRQKMYFLEARLGW